MAIEIITLPGHLRVLFDKVYEGEPVSGNAWVVWQRVLQARIQEPAFFRRLSTVQLACRILRQEVDGFSVGAASITSRTKTSWIQAIDQLTSLTHTERVSPFDPTMEGEGTTIRYNTA